jgi:ribosomal protein S4
MTKTRTQKKPNWKLQNAKPSKHNGVEKVVNESKHREQRRENLWVLVSRENLQARKVCEQKELVSKEDGMKKRNGQISSSLFF